MRKLKTKDIFAAMRFINRFELGERLTAIITDSNDAEVVGLKAFCELLILAGDERCEMGLYELLGGVFEKSTEEMAELDLEELAEGLEKLARENDLPVFFMRLKGLMSIGQQT